MALKELPRVRAGYGATFASRLRSSRSDGSPSLRLLVFRRLLNKGFFQSTPELHSISFPPEFIDHLPQMRTNVFGNLPDYDVMNCLHGRNGIYGGHFNIPVLLLLHDDIAG